MATRGRPLKYKTVEELQEAIGLYFLNCIADNKPFTIAGLALALDMSRQELLVYQGKKEFSDTIKKAKNRCEAYAEESLWTARNAAGVMFNLKNNYGWVDKQEVDMNAKIESKLEDFF